MNWFRLFTANVWKDATIYGVPAEGMDYNVPVHVNIAKMATVTI